MIEGREQNPWPDEPWEREIGELLGSLPTSIEPPPGFIASAVNVPPLHTARVVGAVVAASMVAVALAVGVGDRWLVAPSVDELAERHVAAEAVFLPDSSTAGGATLGSVDEDDDEMAEWVMSAIDGYERAGTVASDELPQAVYRRPGEAISVFTLDGPVDWDALDPGGRERVGGAQAWSDDERSVTVIETSDGAVAVVGIGPTEVLAAVAGAAPADPPPERTVLDRAGDLATSIADHLGFPTG